jgi:hypothetical protein
VPEAGRSCACEGVDRRGHDTTTTDRRPRARATRTPTPAARRRHPRPLRGGRLRPTRHGRDVPAAHGRLLRAQPRAGPCSRSNSIDGVARLPFEDIRRAGGQPREPSLMSTAAWRGCCRSASQVPPALAAVAALHVGLAR